MKGSHPPSDKGGASRPRSGPISGFWRKAVLVWAGIALGMFGLAGFVTAVEWTNRTEFCTSCHSMKQNLVELKDSVHHLNRSGVHAECADCHVPRALGPKLMRKVMAVNDIIAEIKGTIDTPEKFEARRPVLAERVWAYMADSNSRECRNCHAFENMAMSKQGTAAKLKHPEAALQGKTCINCHKGVAHRLPSSKDDM